MVQTLQNTVEVPQLQLVDFLDLVVDISVVVQRQFPLVLFRTIEILQLQHTDKMIDVPVVPVQVPSAGVGRRQPSSHIAVVELLRRQVQFSDTVVDMPVGVQ